VAGESVVEGAAREALDDLGEEARLGQVDVSLDSGDRALRRGLYRAVLCR
jgi:hypothetical protein